MKKNRLLIFVLLVLVILMCIIIASYFNKSNMVYENTSIENSEENSIIKESMLEDENTVENQKNEENKLSIESLVDTVYAFDFYKNVIDEFDSIENASQDYLFGVAHKSLLMNVNNKDMYQIKYDDFNNELVKIFGSKADRLLKKENISKDEYKYNAETDTYAIIGRGGAENNINSFIISDINGNENKYSVTIYEYIWKSVDKDRNPEGTSFDNSSYVWICGLDGKRILEFSVKEEKGFDGNYEYISNKIYDKDGILVDDMKEYLKEHLDVLKNKRVINIDYDTETDKYIVVSNKIIK